MRYGPVGRIANRAVTALTQIRTGVLTIPKASGITVDVIAAELTMTTGGATQSAAVRASIEPRADVRAGPLR
ncbi:hypothetical protein F4554_000254 [Actinopolymorpha rutila]|uniref:Uncharacterized protein n=1 Tax=Actinopolymorpha rutila TaxID=446787 RepID=A0A852ZH65_9ACTN|nr:hypothetical protein [Actinopolymorpha rutila]